MALVDSDVASDVSAQPNPTAERILDAATREFAEKGIAGTGMRALAGAAGVSVPTLYNHFESKERIVAAVFAREGIVADVVFEVPSLPAGLAERLEVVATAELALVRRHYELARLVTRESANGTPEALAVSDGFVDGWVRTWRDTLAGAEDIRPDIDLDAAAEAIKCCMWGIVSVMLLGDRPAFDPELSVRAMVTTMAAGLSR
jgi:AcrR family transcriptional regulator